MGGRANDVSQSFSDPVDDGVGHAEAALQVVIYPCTVIWRPRSIPPTACRVPENW